MSDFKHEGNAKLHKEKAKDFISVSQSYIGHQLLDQNNATLLLSKDGKIVHTFDEATLQRIDKLTAAIDRLAATFCFIDSMKK
jgi:hypothetical protein